MATATAAFALPVALFAAGATAGVQLAPHLAEYDLPLVGQPDAPDIVAASGRLVLEFTGAACVGYTNDARIVTEIETGDGDRLITDARTKTVEATDGSMEFFNETFAEGRRVELSVGIARRDGEGLSVDLTEPTEETFFVGGDLAFPTEHVLAVLDAARLNKTFVAIDIYDGSQDGSLVVQTAAVIGEARIDPSPAGDGAVIVEGGFADMTHWPVTISFFEKRDVRADVAPDFMLSLLLYDNGVSRSYLIDFGEFELRGRLTSLRMLPLPSCG